MKLQHLPSPVNYREDINGLRSWAVIAVLLFHFQLIGLPGGFIGVDIFFVISGYLMTSIIVGGYLKGGFSITKFYMARIRRILPALLVVVITLLIAGWFWLPTIDYKELSNQAVYAIGFISNFYFWQSTNGYFTGEVEDIWLLHTWSLAVEAQFYLLFPILVAILFRFSSNLRTVTIVMLSIAVLSFTLAIYFNETLDIASFFLLPTRGWELAAGGLVFLVLKQTTFSAVTKLISYWLGWALLIIGFIVITKYDPWPGVLTLLPVLGTSLIIFASKDTFLTNNVIAQWVGDRSYSLYLWHWPIVVALYFSSTDNKWGWVLLGLSLSFILAALSYRFVEVPTRRYLSNAEKRIEFKTIFISLTIILSAGFIIKTTTFDGRISQAIEVAANEKNNFNWDVVNCKYARSTNSFEHCVFDGNQVIKDLKVKPDIVLLGDSHAQMVVTPLIEVAKERDLKVQPITANGCSFQVTSNPRHASCQGANYVARNIIDKLKKDVPVVVANATHYVYHFEKKEFIKSYVDSLCYYAENRPVYVLRPLPVMNINPPTYLSRSQVFGRHSSDIKTSEKEFLEFSAPIIEAQDLASKQCGVKVLDLMPYYCSDGYCFASENGRPLYRDKTHLSQFGAERLKPLLKEIAKN